MCVCAYCRFVCACVHTHVHVYGPVCTLAYVHECTCTCGVWLMCTHVHMCALCACVCTCSCACMLVDCTQGWGEGVSGRGDARPHPTVAPWGHAGFSLLCWVLGSAQAWEECQPRRIMTEMFGFLLWHLNVTDMMGRNITRLELSEPRKTIIQGGQWAPVTPQDQDQEEISQHQVINWRNWGCREIRHDLPPCHQQHCRVAVLCFAVCGGFALLGRTPDTQKLYWWSCH